MAPFMGGEARAPIVSASATFNIPFSFYYGSPPDGSGINGAEFAMCLHQLLFVVIATGHERPPPEGEPDLGLGGWSTFGVQWAREPFRMEYHGARVKVTQYTCSFHRMIKGPVFDGGLHLLSVTIKPNQPAIVWFQFALEFGDADGGLATGDVVVAIVSGPQSLSLSSPSSPLMRQAMDASTSSASVSVRSRL